MKRRANPPKRRRNQISSADASPSRLPVVLTAVNPRPQVCLFTEDHGTFCLSGTEQLKPDVGTLSTLQPKCGEWHEVSVFGSESQAKGGLQDHLSRFVDHKRPASMPDFLQQSERIFRELIVLTEECDQSTKTEPSNSSSTWTLQYAEELTRQLRWLEHVHASDAVQELSGDLLTLRLQYRDAAERLHAISLKMSPDSFPIYCPGCVSELPIKWRLPWAPFQANGDNIQVPTRLYMSTNINESDEMGGLVGIYADFIRLVDKYQDFWNELDDLDANTWILEPSSQPPCRSISERRIAVTDMASIVVGLDINCPRGPPASVRWVGAETAAYRDRLDRYVATSTDKDSGWRQNLSFKENLERALGIYLPSPPSETEEGSLECSICYSHVLPTEEGSSELPDAVCDNEPCKRYYHETCLREWLQSLPSSRKSFDRIIGTCPYCSEPISATMQQTY